MFAIFVLLLNVCDRVELEVCGKCHVKEPSSSHFETKIHSFIYQIQNCFFSFLSLLCDFVVVVVVLRSWVDAHQRGFSTAPP